MAISFDLFGTLVAVERPADPADAVAESLAARSVRVPDDWEDAYRSAHRDYDRGREAPLDEHVRLALASRGVEITAETATEAVLDAFDSPVTVREGSVEALDAAAQRGPVAVVRTAASRGWSSRRSPEQISRPEATTRSTPSSPASTAAGGNRTSASSR